MKTLVFVRIFSCLAIRSVVDVDRAYTGTTQFTIMIQQYLEVVGRGEDDGPNFKLKAQIWEP